MQEREQDYQKARARIMGDTGSSGGGGGSGGLEDSGGPPAQLASSRSGAPRPAALRRHNSGGGGQNGLQRKAVLRNKDEELRDPDFRRAHGMCALPAFPLPQMDHLRVQG